MAHASACGRFAICDTVQAPQECERLNWRRVYHERVAERIQHARETRELTRWRSDADLHAWARTSVAREVERAIAQERKLEGR